MTACQNLPVKVGENLFGSTPTAEATIQATSTATVPAVTPTATSSPVPVLGAKEIHESSQSPKYTIDVRWPELSWGDDPRVTTFNQTAETFATEAVKSFKDGVEMAHDPTLTDYSSSLRIDYQLVNSAHGIMSVKLTISYYSAGAAHPGSFTHSINYDLQQGKILYLEDLFQSDSQYLETISSYCMNELKAKDVLFWEEGALPRADNYQVWNISPEGLQITFDEYQVAPYAAGPQSVQIPYSDVKSLARPDGPLAAYITQ